MEDTKVDFQ